MFSKTWSISSFASISPTSSSNFTFVPIPLHQIKFVFMLKIHFFLLTVFDSILALRSQSPSSMHSSSISILTALSKKTRDLSTRRSQRAQSLRVFQSPLGFSNASVFSARSAVKLEDIVISLKNSTVPF